MTPRRPAARPPAGRSTHPRSGGSGPGEALLAALRAVLAATGLLALLVAVPVALLATSGSPVDGTPSWDAVREFPTTVASDEAILGVMTVALWLTWLVFVASVAAEVVAQLRGRSGSAHRVGGPLQRLASYLVGSLLIGVGSLGSGASAIPAGASSVGAVVEAPVTAPAAPAPSASQPVVAGGGLPGPDAVPGAGHVPTAASTPTRTTTVQRGDTPWSLAATHLGDGARWREVWELNRSRTQPDGAAWVSPDAGIRPGWQLLLPSDAADAGAEVTVTGVGTAAQAAPAAGSGSAGEVTVEPGDNLWALAESELAAAWGRQPTDAEVAGYWQSYVEGNRDRLLPPHDPDLIYPGQVFTAPSPPTDPTAPPPPPAPPEPPSPPPSGGTEVPGQAPPGPEAPSPPPQQPQDAPIGTEVPAGGGEVVPSPPVEGGGAAPPSADQQPPTSPVAEQAADSDGGSLIRPVGLLGGGVALVGVLLLLERRRRAQQRHRRPGHAIALPPPDLQRSEEELRAGADLDGARLLDVALRAAAAASGASGLPPLRWVEVEPDSVMLVLGSPAPAPPGFTAVAADRWLTRGLPDHLASAATRMMAPAPTLVPLGTTPDGAELLVELETSGVVTIDGPRDEVVGLMRMIAVAASTPPWGDDPQVLLVGLEGRLTELPGVRSTTLAEALDAAEDRADRVGSALRSARCPGIAPARAAGETPDEWEPLVVVSTLAPGDDEQRRLAALAARPSHAVAVVVPAANGDGAPGRKVTTTDDGWLLVDGVDVEILPRYLDDEDADVVTELLTVAASHADVPFTVAEETVEGDDGEEPAPAAEPAPLPGLEVLLAEVDVLVRVLGEVEAVRCTAPGMEERLVPARQKGLEAVAYMALREGSVDREDLEGSLFPGGSNASKTIYNAISTGRALVGEDLFPPPSGGRYELSPRVVTDYELFCVLFEQAKAIDNDEVATRVLSDALGLVRGEPFTGAGRGYAWVGPHRGMVVGPVVDAAEKLAELRLAARDWRAAEWAARQGLLAFPCDERLYRILMRAASVAGNVPGVHRVFRELCELIADGQYGVEPDDTLHPETIGLLEELTGRLKPTPGAGQRAG